MESNNYLVGEDCLPVEDDRKKPAQAGRSKLICLTVSEELFECRRNAVNAVLSRDLPSVMDFFPGKNGTLLKRPCPQEVAMKYLEEARKLKNELIFAENKLEATPQTAGGKWKRSSSMVAEFGETKFEVDILAELDKGRCPIELLKEIEDRVDQFKHLVSYEIKDVIRRRGEARERRQRRRGELAFLGQIIGDRHDLARIHRFAEVPTTTTQEESQNASGDRGEGA